MTQEEDAAIECHLMWGEGPKAFSDSLKPTLAERYALRPATKPKPFWMHSPCDICWRLSDELHGFDEDNTERCKECLSAR